MCTLYKNKKMHFYIFSFPFRWGIKEKEGKTEVNDLLGVERTQNDDDKCISSTTATTAMIKTTTFKRTDGCNFISCFV